MHPILENLLEQAHVEKRDAEIEERARQDREAIDHAKKIQSILDSLEEEGALPFPSGLLPYVNKKNSGSKFPYTWFHLDLISNELAPILVRINQNDTGSAVYCAARWDTDTEQWSTNWSAWRETLTEAILDAEESYKYYLCRSSKPKVQRKTWKQEMLERLCTATSDRQVMAIIAEALIEFANREE